jgi:hypothetical protein
MKEEGVKPSKSINTETDDFVKDEKGKYYHINCFKGHLKKRLKKNDDEIDLLLQERIEITKLEVAEAKEKDKFLKWIMDFYDGSLPTYFLKKLQSIRKGSYEGINEPISFETLLDIYMQMEKYLKKIALTKNISNVTQQMNYDLAVIVGNYGNYKKYKYKQQLENEKATKAIETIDEQKKIESAISKRKTSKDDEFNLSDVVNEILL